MKRNRHGKAKILSHQEIHLLFSQGLPSHYYQCLFAVAFFLGARINEVCTLYTEDAYNRRGYVRPCLTIRKQNTKGKKRSRSLPVCQDLRPYLKEHYPQAGKQWLFPGLFSDSHIHPDSAARVLRKSCKRIGLDGVSTHSFRRTALTHMYRNGVSLRTIAEYSGHENLDQLERYLAVDDDQLKGAVASLSLMSPRTVPSEFPNTVDQDRLKVDFEF